ncbi:MAG TPA: hypothetical protein VJQ26_01030 [Ktedonobacteraceae bacterium]|nr:hypothetical protein [Ktedonobacteraceae bacterium]
MRKRLFVLLNLVLVLSLVMVSPAAAKDFQRGLQPGQQVTYEQKVPINIVFIGYPRNTIDKDEMLDVLPDSYAPIVRYPPFYGLQGRDMGLNFNFEYKVTFAGQDLANRFFRYLKQIGTAGEPTDYQLAYNDQETNVLDVGDEVLYVDAPSVEKWLARNFAKEKGYTVVFINWYSRSDFNFHVYTKTDVVDTDTGYNFGEIRPTRKMIAWGGSSSRLWFYDLSAGPEAWTDNWVVDVTDLDDNGAEDYRMPPIWEYDEDGYRDPSALSSDLGLVTRFVGINLLFTASPLYDPLATAPGPGGRRIVHINMFEDDPDSLGTDWINTSEVQAQFERFQPYYDWEVNLVDTNPIDPEAQRALRIFAELDPSADCWNQFGTPFAELFCFFDLNRADYIPDYGTYDNVTGIFAFNTTADNLAGQFGLLGFADDNWVDGTPSYVFQFDGTEYRDLGYGFTTTTVHEGGHHFGLSHPHDGYDSELGLDYGPADDFYFAWSGDESNTVMHYLALSNEFGQFDQDNMYRWEMAGYLNWSNALLAEIQAHPNAKQVRERVRVAKNFAEIALKSFDQWKFRQAAANAYKAYDQLARAAVRLGIGLPGEDKMLISPTMVPVHEGDPIRFPDN